MRSIVVENEMNLLLAGDLGINTTQKQLQKLLVPMAPMTRANNLSGLYVECGKERRHAVTQVVVRLPLRYARAHWENRLSAIERLHLRFFIDAEDDRVFRRRHVETNDVTRLFDKEWVGRQLESFRAMRLETEGVPYAHDRRLREARFGCQFARSPMRRALGTRRQRLATTASRRSSPIFRGGPDLGASLRPCNRSRQKRDRHLQTVALEMASRPATSLLDNLQRTAIRCAHGAPMLAQTSVVVPSV